MSLVIKRADQTKSTVPRFATPSMDQRWHGLQIHIIGVLDHALVCHLRLFTMTKNHSTCAIHVVKAVHRVINGKAPVGKLPCKHFLHVDNCSRGIKNSVLISYMECLIHCCLFDEIEIGFLPKGHTQSEIDQKFSTMARLLCTHDAITLSYMHAELSNCYIELTELSSIDQFHNWSGIVGYPNVY